MLVLVWRGNGNVDKYFPIAEIKADSKGIRIRHEGNKEFWNSIGHYVKIEIF